MGYTYVLVNPAKREYVDPARLGVASGRFMLSQPTCALVLTRLIADPPIGGGPTGGRWVGDPVILAGGSGGSPASLHDRATEDPGFTDISYQALADLYDDSTIRDDLLGKAADDDRFFVDLCNALMQHRPAVMRDPPFTRLLGTDWRKRYERSYRASPWYARRSPKL